MLSIDFYYGKIGFGVNSPGWKKGEKKYRASANQGPLNDAPELTR